jgi:para-nitrobenzyl esterase
MGEGTTSIVVRTSAGAVGGRQEDGMAVFRGIPFAAPPVGHLRFRAPGPAERWDGVRQADVFGPQPPQMFSGPPPPAAAVTAPARHTPTDWLTVNVWTPEVGRHGLPVMVYLYGGAYRAGHAGDPMIDGGILARSGVVVVTGNHRVGMEGYASLGGAPDNRALLDQIALLRWVQEEITAFGGDPARVTIFGESAGAGAVANLLASPAGTGLFVTAIAQSVPGTYFTPRLARDIAAELVAPLGLPPTAEALRDTDPGALAATAAAFDTRMGPFAGRTGALADRWGPVAGTVTPFSPVVDGEVLPEDPWTALAAGAARDVRLMAGHTRDEWRLFLVNRGLLGRVTDADADWALRTFGPGTDPATSVRAAYPQAGAEELFTLVQSDWLFRMPSLHLAAAHAAGGGRAHLYELTYRAPAFGAILGACHALDVPLVFGTLTVARDFFGDSEPQEAVEVSRRMRAAWVSMATNGDPGWLPFDEKQRLAGVFDVRPTLRVQQYPEERSRALWSDHRFSTLDLLT